MMMLILVLFCVSLYGEEVFVTVTGKNGLFSQDFYVTPVDQV